MAGCRPPARSSTSELALIHDWIAEGAPWPQDAVLKQPEKKAEAKPNAAAEMENVQRIRAAIVAKKSDAAAKSYKTTIPNTTVSYDMTPIPARRFRDGLLQAH